MAATLDVACPNCEKPLKVPATLEGKRVKCKSCGETFAVKAPAAAPKADLKKPAAAPKPEPPPEQPKSPFLDDDEDDTNPRPMGVIKEDDTARCPHCAKVLDPPEAAICVHCGFNNRTRMQAEKKTVYAADTSDYVKHLGPGIVAALIVIGLIVLIVISWVNMEDWLTDSFLQDEKPDPLTGGKKFYVRPGAFIALIIAMSLVVMLPALRFAIRRLVKDYKPEEKRKK